MKNRLKKKISILFIIIFLSSFLYSNNIVQAQVILPSSPDQLSIISSKLSSISTLLGQLESFVSGYTTSLLAQVICGAACPPPNSTSTAPVISGVSASSLTSSGAIINWTTDQPADSQVVYGTTATLGSATTLDTTLTTSHSEPLSGLSPATSYYYAVRSKNSSGLPTISGTYSFTTLPSAPPPSPPPSPSPPGPVPTSGSIPITVIDPPTTNFPISQGIPFPEGALSNLANLRLVDSSNSEVPAQFSSLVQWPDGSYKSILVDFIALPSVTNYTLQYGTGVVRSPYSTGLTYNQDASDIYVTNNSLKFAVNKNAFTLFDQVWKDLNGNGIFEDSEKMLSAPGDVVVEGNYFTGNPANTYKSSLFTAADGYTVSVEEAGPVRITLLAKGKLKGPIADVDGDYAFTDFEIRLHFYAGSSMVKVVYTLLDTKPRDSTPIYNVWDAAGADTFTTPHIMEIKDVELVLPLNLGSSQYAFGGDAGTSNVYTGSATGEKYLFQDAVRTWTGTQSDTANYAFNYSGAGTGQKSQGWSDISEGTKWGVGAGIRWFWEEYPRELNFNSATNNLTVFLQPPRSPNVFYSALQAGVAKTHQVFLDFHTGNYQTAQIQNIGYSFQKPPIALPPLSWMDGSGVFGPISPQDSNSAPYDLKVQGIWNWKQHIGYEGGYPTLYGQRDFGDYEIGSGVGGGPAYDDNHYNNVRNDMLQFLRSGDRKWYDESIKSSWFHTDIDVKHVNGTNSGRIYQNLGPGENHYHPPGEHEIELAQHLGHVVMGEDTDYLMTGEKRFLESTREQGDWNVALAKTGAFDLSLGNYFEEQRSHGWPLVALMQAYNATGDRKYLDGASIIVDNAIWWWQHPHQHIVLSPDSTKWSDVVENMDLTTGHSAWITNEKTDNCYSGNYTVSDWMAQYLLWGNWLWYNAVKNLGLSSYSFSGTYLGNVTIPLDTVDNMMTQNTRFIVDYQWKDPAYVAKYPWINNFTSADEYNFAYSPCAGYYTYPANDGNEVLPYLLLAFQNLSYPSVAEKTKWQDIAIKAYTKQYITSSDAAANCYGYYGAPCMMTIPYFLTLRYGTPSYTPPPSPSPPPGSLSNITFTPNVEGHKSLSGDTFTINIYNSGQTTPAYSFNATSGSVIMQSSPLSPGTYDISISTPYHLRRKLANVSLSSNQTITMPLLYAGDLNNDSSINSLDWSIMSAKWFTNDPISDVNQDGIVNSIDFSFMNKNWGKSGD